MKKLLLIASLFMAFIAARVSAQIPNNSFENWKLDTFYLAAGQISSLPADTITFMDPVNWSSSNTLTGLDSLGGISLVTQSSTAYHGTSAVRMVTDSIKLPVIPNFPALKLTIPGFILNGDFPINANSLITSGSVISPVSLLGAGQPFTSRLGKIKGYYDYTPAFNPNTNSNDTCVIWATLRKGTLPVADAIFKSTAATGGYQPFEASFVYHTCDMPDTLVVLLASSVPNVATILGGSSGLVSGSVLLVDSIYYENLPGGYNFPPIARFDTASTNKNIAKTIQVKDNDEDCDDSTPSLTVSVLAQPTNGTATVTAGAIEYTPNTNFWGIDSFTYTLSDGNSSSIAGVRIFVFNVTGISEANEIPVYLFPNPANDVLNIKFESKGATTLRVFDAAGKLALISQLTNTSNAVGISSLANGIYSIQLADENDVVIARSKFTVNK